MWISLCLTFTRSPSLNTDGKRKMEMVVKIVSIKARENGCSFDEGRKRTGCTAIRMARWLLAAKERKRTVCTGVRMAEWLFAPRRERELAVQE